MKKIFPSKSGILWYVYIVKCNDNTLYCGSTTNLQRRLNEHNTKKGAKYTRGRTPVKLVFYQSCKNQSEAFKLESRIKKLNRNKKIDLIMNKEIALEITQTRHSL